MTVSFDVQFWTFLQHFQAQVPDSPRNLRPQRLIFNYPLYYTARFPELIRYFEVLLRQVVRVDPLMTWYGDFVKVQFAEHCKGDSD